MLNDTKWEPFDESEEFLKNCDGMIIARLRKHWNEARWICTFSPQLDNVDVHFSLELEGIKSVEEARWQATAWIYNQCNYIANHFHRIRDHLPSVHELAEEVGL